MIKVLELLFIQMYNVHYSILYIIYESQFQVIFFRINITSRNHVLNDLAGR